MFAHSLRSAFIPLMDVLAAFSAGAATTTIKIAIDTDNNSSTGCSVAVGGATFSGAEQLWITTYDPDAHAVTGVTQQRCSGSTFGGAATIDTGGWSVGVNGGVNAIETHMP